MWARRVTRESHLRRVGWIWPIKTHTHRERPSTQPKTWPPQQEIEPTSNKQMNCHTKLLSLWLFLVTRAHGGILSITSIIVWWILLHTLAETRTVGGASLRSTPLDVCTVIRRNARMIIRGRGNLFFLPRIDLLINIVHFECKKHHLKRAAPWEEETSRAILSGLGLVWCL